MERFSNLYGTVSAGGVYSPMGSSERLPEFFNKIGAVNPTATVEAVRGALAGFPKMDASAEAFRVNYYAQPGNDLPVAVRYAPMHLYKKPGMPKGMQAFCALSVNGNENKQEGEDKRVTTYSHTYYIAREHMHQAVTGKSGERITYLDQIFGTELLNHIQVADHRSGKVPVNFDQEPHKVHPKLPNKDAAIAYNVVHAVFAEQPVVIRLEKGCSFNARAWELLIPIYAMLPPRLATEVGFATYQDPTAIRGLVADTSMRIFLLPAECELKAVADAGMLVMDLNDPATVPAVARDELTKALNRWNKLAWELRQEAMEKIFADTEATFQDQELFIKRTKEFFENPFFQWEKSVDDKGSVATLAELKAKYDSFPLCAQIPWVRDRFVKKIPQLLKKGVTFQQLTADALALALYSKDEEEKKVSQQLYRFATELAPAEALPVAKFTGKLVALQGEEKKEAAVAAEKARHAVEMAAERERFDQELAAEKEKTAKAIADGEAAVAAEQEKAAAALAAEQAKAAAALAAEQEKTEQVKKIAAEKIKAERDAHQATQTKLAETQTQLTGEQEAHKATQAKLGAEQTAHQATQAKLDTAVSTLERAKTAFEELKKAKAAVDAKVDGADAAKAEAEAAKAEAVKAKADADAAKAKSEKIIQENNKRMIIFVAAGFLVAALIFGVIMLIMGLGKDKEPVETTPTIATEATTEATEEPTEAPTEAPTEEPTEAPTEATEPDLTDWSDDAAAEWLEENVESVESVNYCENADTWTEEIPEGYLPLAEITFLDAEGIAYLYRLDENQVNAMPPVVFDEPEADQDETDEETEEETAEPAAMLVEGSVLEITAGEFLLVVSGDADAIAPAMEVLGQILEEEQEISSLWSVNETVFAVDNAVAELLEDAGWWRRITAVTADGEDYAEQLPVIDEEGLNGLYLELAGDGLLVFVDAEDEIAVAALTEDLEKDGICAVDGTLVVANIPIEKAE